MALAPLEDAGVVVAALPLPPRPSPPPAPAEPPSPRPIEALTPRLKPEESALKPTPALTPAETETPTDAERLAPRIGLLDGPTTTPPLAPTPGSRVAVARTHPLRMLPPLLHVPVIERLFDVGRVTSEFVGMEVESDTDGNPTPTPAPTVTEAATVAETLTLIDGSPDSKDETPFAPAAGT